MKIFLQKIFNTKTSKGALIIFILFYILTVAIRPAQALADDGDNPFVPTTDALNTGLTAQVGGDSLTSASQDIAQLTDITGAYYDSTLNRIVFIGTTNGTLHYNKDDMAVAIKSIMFNNTVPDVNIGDDPNNPTGSTALVSYTGPIQNTNLGSVLFNSDYKFKQYAIGYDPSNTKITSTVPTYKSVVDRYLALNPTPVNGNESKFILSPLNATLKNATSSSAFVFTNLSMQATAQQINPNNDPLWNQAAQNFATDMTSNYDQYAQENTSLAQAKQIAKIVAILKWVSDNNIQTDFNWARNYTTQTASTPATVQKVTTPVNNGYSAQGEVTFTTPNSYIPDDGTAAALKTASQAVSGSKEDVTWNFTSGGTQYQAVAVAAGAFKSLGAHTTSALDFNYPSAGDTNIIFKRSYSSFSNAQFGIGLGWDFMPARIYPNAAVSTDTTICNGVTYYQKLAVDTENGHETFTFSCPSGYSPDDPSFHSKVVQNNDGSATVTLKNQTKYKFDSFFELTQILDKNSNALNFNYASDSGNLTSIADTHSHTLSVSYNGQNLISQVSDWAGNAVKYFYNGSGDLTSVQDPNGNTTTYTYDSNNRLATVTDRNGQLVLTNTYGGDNRIATSKDAANLLTTYTYDNVNKVITLTDSNGRVKKTTYDDKARILQQTDPAGKSNNYTYGNEVLPLTFKDRNNNQETFTYDGNGNMLTVAFPDTSTITYTYDGNNRVTKRLDGRYSPTKETDFTYDANGNQTQKTEAGVSTNYTYNSAGDLLTLTDPLNHTTTWTRDTFGNQLTQTDALNNTSNYTYDSLGRLIKSTDANNVSVSYTYDANGNLLTKSDGTSTTTNVYDKEDQLKSVTDGNGSVTSYAYNPTGTVSTVTDPLNNVTSYGYDSYQQITSRTDALNHLTTNTFDQLNRITQSTTPLGKVSKWTYDNNGNILSRIDANNNTTTYTYDSLNRLTKITYPDTKTVTFTYDSRGNKTQMVDAVGTSTYTYDNFDRLTQSTDEYGHTIIYTYDNAGNMKTLKYPDLSLVTYNYDADNNMTSVVDWNNHTTSYTYNKNGTLATRTLPNGIVTNYSYDTANQLANITHQLSGTTLAQFNYIRDGIGDITDAVEQGSFISPPNGNTWYAQYYDNQTLSGAPKLTRLDNTLSFNWGTGSPDSSIPSDHFSARWTRAVVFSATGSYKFTSTSDDGARIYVDGELIYDNWNGSGLTTVNTTKDITSGTHVVVYEYQENTGSAQASLSITQVTNPYAAQYFNNQTLTGTPTLTRNDNAINFNWGTGSPGTGIPNDHFSARWTRTDNFANGNYTFTTTTNDGVRLYIDNSVVIDKWTDVTATSAATYSTSQNLTAGNHTIKMEYYEATGSATAILNYQPTQFTAQYYNNQNLSGSPTLTRQENTINNSWGTGSPDPSIPSDHFSARWTKTQNFAAGVYLFSTTTDDGARLYIDNNLVIDKWVDQNATWTIAQKLSSGTHTIKMEYYDDTGNATAKLVYQQVAPQNLTSFTYDAAGRLTKALYANNNSYSYTYDKAGNILSDNIVNDPNNGTYSDSFVYDNDYKLTNVNGYTTFNYDNNGNMLEKPSQSPNPDIFYQYNFENNLTQFYNANTNNTYNYTYDGLGNRLRTDFSTTITRYVTDMSGDLPRTLATYIGPNGNGVVGTDYLYGLGIISEGGSSYYLEDGLGNTRFITNSTGGNAGSTSYDPYGNLRSFNSTGTFLFQKQLLDGESGNYYMRDRFYDPSLHRFLSKDSQSGNVLSAQSQTPFTYSNDDPINFSDPSGDVSYKEASQWAKGVISGIYTFISAKTGLPYIGKSKNIPRRLQQHVRSGKLSDQTAKTVKTRAVAPKDQPVEEQKDMNAKGIPGKTLDNKINAVQRSQWPEKGIDPGLNVGPGDPVVPGEIPPVEILPE